MRSFASQLSFRLVILFSVLSVFLAACAPSSPSAAPTDQAGEATTAAVDSPTTSAETAPITG